MKPTNRPCSECGDLNRTHTVRCKSRGYAAVGPHPDAPPREAAPALDPTPCPCGIARLDCEYHCPAPQTRCPDYEAFDLAPGTPTLQVAAVGPTVLHGGAPPAGWRLLGPDDPEVSSDLIYATPGPCHAPGVPQSTPRDAHLAQRQADAVVPDALPPGVLATLCGLPSWCFGADS